MTTWIHRILWNLDLFKSILRYAIFFLEQSISISYINGCLHHITRKTYLLSLNTLPSGCEAGGFRDGGRHCSSVPWVRPVKGLVCVCVHVWRYTHTCAPDRPEIQWSPKSNLEGQPRKSLKQRDLSQRSKSVKSEEQREISASTWRAGGGKCQPTR